MRTRATLLLSILLLAPILTALFPQVNSAAFVDKKIGPWIGSNKSGSATTWAERTFNGNAKYAIAQVQTGIGAASGTTSDMDDGVGWARDFGIASRGYDDGQIEISVIHGFGGAIHSESAWSHFQNVVVPTLRQGQPQTKYLGIEKEFACHQNSGCDRTRFFNDDAWRKTLYDRFASIVVPAGFVVLHYMPTFDNDPNYSTVIVTTFPTWGDPAVILNPVSYNTAEYVGAEIGVWVTNAGGHGGDGSWDGSYSDSCDCLWAQYVANGVIDNWHLRTDQNGHFLFLAGPTTNLRSKQAVVDDPVFQQWIMDRQSLYNEFVWIGNTVSGLSTYFAYAPSSASVGVTITFSASASGGTPPFTFSWDFSDSTTATGQTVTHAYSAPGLYTVSLSTVDPLGQRATYSRTVAVSPFAVSWTSSPSNPSPGQTVTFTGTASGGTAPYSFLWDFGDGARSTGNPVSHFYGADGAYSVNLEVADSGGRTATATQSLTIGTPPPSALPSPGPIEILIDMFNALRNPFNLMMALAFSTLIGMAFGVSIAKRHHRGLRRPIMLSDRI